MGNRLSKIYTKTGDKGTTGLANGERINKNDIRVQCFGDIDELNSALGIVKAQAGLTETMESILTRLQHELFDLGSELCLPGYEAITEEHVTQLENDLNELNDTLPPLKEFILPGGHPAAAQCQLARAICRRAERSLTTLNEAFPITTTSLKYINRLSDLLFVLARFINKENNVAEPLWQHEKAKK
jgi:cob(I)alamin adenosyltransferase